MITPFDIAVREFQEVDSISDLTRLVRTAYQSLADMGLFFWGTRQTEEETKQRVTAAHTTLVGYHDARLIATISLYPSRSDHSCAHYHEAWYFGQFAVMPELQRTGIGSYLLDEIEHRAVSAGASRIALDTAEPAGHLIRYYEKRGYAFVQHQQWDKVNYRSVILSKRLR